MPRKQDHCRDCDKCTESGMAALGKKLANGTLIVCTVGLSALAARMFNSGRRVCPQCGHPLAIHAMVGRRFKD